MRLLFTVGDLYVARKAFPMNDGYKDCLPDMPWKFPRAIALGESIRNVAEMKAWMIHENAKVMQEKGKIDYVESAKMVEPLLHA